MKGEEIPLLLGLLLCDDRFRGVTLAICGTVAYVAYVVVTHGDGAVFGAFCAFLGAIGGRLYGKRKEA